MSDLPTKVKVGFHTYRIEDWDPRVAAAEGRYGTCSTMLRLIKIDTAHGRRQASATLLHEIMHACYWLWKIEDNFDQEQTVGPLSNGLATVFRDNPDVASWITEGMLVDDEVTG